MEKIEINGDTLDKLGFSEYWDEHGTWGGRTLTFKNGVRFRIIVQDDTDEYGYDLGTESFYFAPWFAIPKKESVDNFYFETVADMKECIRLEYPECLELFNELILAVWKIK